MSDTIVLLQLEHGNIARLLSLLDDQCRRLQSNGPGDLELVEIALEYFRDYPDLCHHPKEDRVFRRLQQRDPERAQQVGNLLGDHEGMAQMTEDMVRGVREARAHGVDGRFLMELRQFIHRYRTHLEAEEQYFFPAALKSLNAEDWAAIDFDVFDRDDPLFDHATEERFRGLRRQIQDATRASGEGS